MPLNIRKSILVSILAVFLSSGFGSALAQTDPPSCDCDFSDIPGVIWWGPQGEMTVADLAAYAAPIFWFSPDEPSKADALGPDINIPEPFPFEDPGTGPVVYYQMKEVVRGMRNDKPIYTEVGSDRGDAVINVEGGALLLLEYYAYYSQEAGFSAHRHDVEGVEVRLAAAVTGGDYLASLGYDECPVGHSVIFVTRITGKAHGIEWYWNILDVGEGNRFPMALLVEEGKHAISPDANGDGYFTPSYDVNVRVNDAWGIRDVIRSGGLFTPSYQAWMTKVRHPGDRVLPPLPADSPLLDDLASHQPEYEGGNSVYELRPLPPATAAAAWDDEQEGDSHLEKFIVGKELPEGPKLSSVSSIDEAWSWVNSGALKRSLSLSAYADGRWGFSWTFPFFIGRNLNVPMTGGYVMQRMYLKGHKLRDFGWTLLFANSASRWMDPYIALGAEWNDFETQPGVTERRTDFVFEAGFKFRTQIGQSPLKFLSFITEFWGLRLGIKNYGFFDIDRFKYVVEIGAGSF